MVHFNRGPWIIAGSIALVAAMAIGLWWFSKERACNDWQDDFRALAAGAQEDATAGTYDAGAYIEGFSRLDEKRPDGCTSPGLTIRR